MVKLYEGCWGKRRNGKIIGPFTSSGNAIFSFSDENGLTYQIDGQYYIDGKESPVDIIEVYPSDPRENNSLELAAEQKASRSEWEVEDNTPPFNLSSREQWRWWFAGQAMQCVDWNTNYPQKDAVCFADALIAELEKGK